MYLCVCVWYVCGCTYSIAFHMGVRGHLRVHSLLPPLRGSWGIKLRSSSFWSNCFYPLNHFFFLIFELRPQIFSLSTHGRTWIPNPPASMSQLLHHALPSSDSVVIVYKTSIARAQKWEDAVSLLNVWLISCMMTCFPVQWFTFVPPLWLSEKECPP